MNIGPKFLDSFSNAVCDKDFLQAEAKRGQAPLNGERLKSIVEKIEKLDGQSSFKVSEEGRIIFDSNSHNKTILEEICLDLIPWKKGPFNLSGIHIDGEWQSQKKWNRIADKLDQIEGKNILDIGCNNGYFLWRVWEKKPRHALGIDPSPQSYLQFQLMKKLLGEGPLFEMLGVQHLQGFKNCFDIILNMGIIYHHRHPLQQLIDIREALVPGGQAIIETIGIPGEESVALFPEDTYAHMKNVWFVPTLSCLINWCKRAKLEHIEVISSDWEGIQEQRVTKWNPKASYADYLDSNDPQKTIEGYPSPERFCLSVRRKKINQ